MIIIKGKKKGNMQTNIIVNITSTNNTYCNMPKSY